MMRQNETRGERPLPASDELIDEAADQISGRNLPVSFLSPEPTILLACGRNREALGATISCMRHRCRLRETGWAEFGYFLCYFKMVAPRALDCCCRPGVS